MPGRMPGPSRNVQSWTATSDCPRATEEAALAPTAPASSCLMVTTASIAIRPTAIMTDSKVRAAT